MIRLLAAVPSVIYGLIALLVLVPFIGNHVISGAEKESVQYVIQLDGTGLIVGVMVLTVMIAPIMVAIITDALRSVPRGWTEGAAALGVNRFRALRTVGLRAARPAIVAAAVLATARALGEAIMLSMVPGSHAFAPNPLDGVTFLFEPALTLAAAIVDNADELSVKPFGQTIYAFAAILLISSAFLSFAGWVARRSMRKYTLDGRGSAERAGIPGARGRASGPASAATSRWSIGDRIGVAAPGGPGLLLCVIAAAIVLYMLVRGLQYLSFSEFFSHPQPGLDQSRPAASSTRSWAPSWSRCSAPRSPRRSGSRSRSG